VRFRSRLLQTGRPTPFSGRYLTRLFLLAGFCVVAMIALGVPFLRERRSTRDAELGRIGRPGAKIQTAISPSPYGDLGLGVILADDRPKQVDDQGTAPAANIEGELLPVDRQLLQHVLDKTSDRSKRPFYHLLTLAASAPPDRLEQHARRDIRYDEIWNDPEKYRGELIYLSGYVVGLRPWEATESEFFNPLRLHTLYDGYLMAEDSRPNPYVIVVPRVADGMPTGTKIAENITFAGYFFKLWRYKSADGTERAAPLLVGQMISWTPAPAQHGVFHLGGYLAAAFLLLVMGLGGAIWAINRRQLRRSGLATPSGPDPQAIAGLAHLEQIDLPDPASSLDQIHEP
jgi:hypothetical protein